MTGDRLSKIVVPSSLVPDLLRQLHGNPASAHFAAEHVWEQARQIGYWPSMFKDIMNWCEQCKATGMTRRFPVPPHWVPMGSSCTTRLFERVAADIVELPLTSKYNR